ncbi:MAG: DUF2089 family protein [Anaerohalosphaeraceae bacterium]
MSRLPIQCPACREQLNVNKLTCRKCQTQVEGLYELPLLLRLESDEQVFVLDFLKCSGSLKEMAALMKLSYPTVRNRLDEIIEKIKQLEQTIDSETREKNQ